jgi:hypothetical protein
LRFQRIDPKSLPPHPQLSGYFPPSAILILDGQKQLLKTAEKINIGEMAMTFAHAEQENGRNSFIF